MFTKEVSLPFLRESRELLSLISLESAGTSRLETYFQMASASEERAFGLDSFWI
jgi:hypothetical protein